MTNDRKQGQEIPNKETQEGQGKNKEQTVQNPDSYRSLFILLLFFDFDF